MKNIAIPTPDDPSKTNFDIADFLIKGDTAMLLKTLRQKVFGLWSVFQEKFRPNHFAMMVTPAKIVVRVQRPSASFSLKIPIIVNPATRQMICQDGTEEESYVIRSSGQPNDIRPLKEKIPNRRKERRGVVVVIVVNNNNKNDGMILLFFILYYYYYYFKFKFIINH